MENNNESTSLENYRSFCSDCKLDLKSLYSTGTASSINERESFIDGNHQLPLKNSNEEIINENNEKFKYSQFLFCKNNFPLTASFIKNKDSNVSQKEKQTLDVEFKKAKEADKDLQKFRIKPKIIEDKILENSKQLKIENSKKRKLEISNYQCNNSKKSRQHSTVKDINTDYMQCQPNVSNDSIDLKNVYGTEKQSKKCTQISNSIEVPIYTKSQHEFDIHTNMKSEYLLRCNELKHTILHRRKTICQVAQDLLTLSTCLNDICDTILEKKETNSNIICPDKSSNVCKKENKSTSPILFSKTCPGVTNLIPSQENSHDMYSYNPYRSKNILQKKI